MVYDSISKHAFKRRKSLTANASGNAYLAEISGANNILSHRFVVERAAVFT